jgi:hypothetical protein
VIPWLAALVACEPQSVCFGDCTDAGESAGTMDDTSDTLPDEQTDDDGPDMTHYRGTVTARVFTGWDDACTCFGEAVLSVWPGGTVDGTAACTCGSGGVSVEGDIEGDLVGGELDASWLASDDGTWAQDDEVQVHGATKGDSLVATFEGEVGWWWLADGVIDASID